MNDGLLNDELLNDEFEMGMTDEQFMKMEFLVRIDELCRMEEETTDAELIAFIKDRKKILRAKLDNL